MNELAPIGKLERVPLRTVWSQEAYDFTKWLQDNVPYDSKVVIYK